MRLPSDIPAAWRAPLLDRLGGQFLSELAEFVNTERGRGPVFPAEADVFRALEMVSPDQVKVMLIGQDPYHDDGQAHGLSFSVPRQMKLPPSLRNIFKELAADLNCPVPAVGDLSSWANQGVLLLNSVLTVRAHAAASHRKRGWEQFTDAVLDIVNTGDRPAVFILWGSFAQAKAPLIDHNKHRIISEVHPSPLSAHRGFFGSRPFSRANAFLQELGRPPVAWEIDNHEIMEFDFQ